MRSCVDWAAQRNESNSLGRVVWLNTRGHAQLVAARVNALRTAGFPAAAFSDILEQPKEIQDALTEALATVRSVLSEEARRLLYRLSLVVPYFKRNHAMRIGSAGAAIDSAGDAFEELVGPWLEQPSPGYYRVSALMARAGEQMLPPEEMKRLHGDIATALLAERVMTPNEFGGVVIHALAGAADAQLAIAAKLFLTAPSDAKKMMAPEVSWMASARIEPDTVPGLSRGARQFVKLFQFEVAGIVAPQRLEAMAASMGKDFAAETDDLTEILPRMMFLVKRLLQIELPLAPGRVVADVLEVERLAARSTAIETGERRPRLAGAKGAKLPSMLSAVLVPRVRSAESIRGLVQALDTLTERDRQRLLKGFGTDDGDLRVLFVGPWVTIESDDQAGWNDYANALDEAVAAGRRWQHHPWMRAAARARSAVLDEMLGRREDAERHVVDIAAEIGTSLGLEDQLAFNHQEDSRAIEIWQRILPTWKADGLLRDTQPLFGARHAAVAAARLDHWRTAAELFGQARRRAKAFNMPWWKAGLLGDEGFALWRSGDLKAAVKVLRKVVGDLETLPNTPDSFAEYAVQKLVGHTLSVLTIAERLGQVREIPPGMCSDLKPHEAIKGLPPTPRIYMWFFLSQLAREASDYKLGSECADKLRDAPFAFLRAEAARHDVVHSIRSWNLSAMPEAAAREAALMDAAQKRKDLHPGEPDPPGLEGELTDGSIGAHVRPALLAAILRAKELGRDVTTLVEEWRSTKGARHPLVANEIDLCRQYSPMGSDELATTLRNGSETAETRSLAAALLVGRTDTSPENALYALVTLVDRANSYDTLKETAGGSVGALARRDWLRLCENRFLLREPGIHVGVIRQACASDAVGWPAVARIILAAIPATSLGVPESLRASLRMMAAEEDG